ncbi:MAG: NAD(P)-dependent glycerol-3-phosphate dehydrogenase [Oscillospiraceae bacterium]|nr:NAD(P)-dependent glycerol-3-phosphate dehydrogenase [Oscillospiraceae bacterium]
MARITVLGGGFGTALAVMLYSTQQHDVTLWSAIPEEIEAMRRDGEQKQKLPGVKIPNGIALTTDLSVIDDSDLILFAIPSAYVRDTCKKVAPHVKNGTVVVNAGKGIEEDTLKLMSKVFAEEIPQALYVVLTGPSHAEEVGRGIPTSVVAASSIAAAAYLVQEWFSSPTFRVYINDDVTGCELGGALKNVIALAAGVSDGLGFGDNTKAALMTRGLHEIERLGTALGSRTNTFAGLTGLGDLIVTCTSMHSRNRRAGILIGQGTDPAAAVEQVGTVEGYYCCHAAYGLAKRYEIEMPITEALYRVLYEGADVREAVQALMDRPKKREYEKLN